MKEETVVTGVLIITLIGIALIIGGMIYSAVIKQYFLAVIIFIQLPQLIGYYPEFRAKAIQKLTVK